MLKMLEKTCVDFIGRFSLPVVMNHMVLENLMPFESEIN